MNDGSCKVKSLGLVITFLLMVGCSDTQPLEPTSSPPPVPSSTGSSPASATASAVGLDFQAPEGWIQEAPSSSMRVAQYRIPREGGDDADSEMVVFHFGGGGGAVQANVDRWVSQFTTGDGGPVSDQARISNRQGNGLAITLVDVSGTYHESQGPMMAETTARSGYRMLAAVVDGPGGPWFLKLTGPENTLNASEAAFESLLASLRVDG